MSKDKILDRLDTAAEILLDAAFPATTAAGEPPPVGEQRSLIDKIKAFDAVRGWVSERAKLIPEDRKSGKGEQLRNKFHGATASGRRNRASIEEGAKPASQGGPGDAAGTTSNSADNTA